MPLIPHNPQSRRLAPRIVGLVVLVFGGWELLGLHVNEPRLPVTAAQAESYTHVPLPPSAHNIKMAGYRQWIGFEHYVRFEAPVSECLQYAAAVAPHAKLQPIDADQLEDVAHPSRDDVFANLSWFDLEKASNVVGAGGTMGQMEQVWVDQTRGVFYFRHTD